MKAVIFSLVALSALTTVNANYLADFQARKAAAQAKLAKVQAAPVPIPPQPKIPAMGRPVPVLIPEQETIPVLGSPNAMPIADQQNILKAEGNNFVNEPILGLQQPPMGNCRQVMLSSGALKMVCSPIPVPQEPLPPVSDACADQEMQLNEAEDNLAEAQRQAALINDPAFKTEVEEQLRLGQSLVTKAQAEYELCLNGA